MALLALHSWSRLLVFGGIVTAQKESVPNRQDKLELGARDAQQLLLLIATDEKGKIVNRNVTRQEWLTFMADEFDTLDKKKTGTINPKELSQSELRRSCFSDLGK